LTETVCKTRKQPTCGPIRLWHGLDETGTNYCDRVTMRIPRTPVIPTLRRVRCTLFAENTSVLFTANNYLAKAGPAPGDTIDVRSAASFELFGAYETSERESEIHFENIGPGERVVVRCTGFGPA
jgi:hypothetical protein